MKIALRGRKGPSGSCYNRRRISDLGCQAAGAKIRHYFHRHSQGNKVKSFVPLSECPQNGKPAIELRGEKEHLNKSYGAVVLTCWGTETEASQQKF
jgi:hypothetical protein